MKKSLIIISIFLIAVIVAGLFFYNTRNNNKIGDELSYDLSLKAENIGVSRIIETLENCQGSSQAQTDAERNQFQFCSYDISDANLTKLKAIKSIRGYKICDFDERDLNNECKIDNYIKQDSEIIWRFDWTQIGVRNDNHYILLVKEGDNYFFVIASDMSSTPYSGSIYIIEDLNSEIVYTLKSN